MNWQVPKIWRGGDAWIIGGGPSIIKQFTIPKKVVTKVRKGEKSLSAYSDYMEGIHAKHVIGVNLAFQIGNWIDMVFFGDHGFYLHYQKQLAAFPGVKISCNPMENKQDWIKYLAKDKQHVSGVSTNPRLVSWNYSSGAAAINVAVHAGAKRIFLLGFDMRLSEDEHQHWHDEYLKGGFTIIKKDKKSGNFTNSPFNMHLKSFPAIAFDAKAMGVEIYNVSPDSKINSFPKVTLKEALKL